MKTTRTLATLSIAIALVALGGSAQGPVAELTKTETDGLIFMREEEKLARDVYTVLAEKWGSRPFSNIASSEERHMAAVKTLLDRYGLNAPADRTKPGEFANATLQRLYTELVKRGSTSRVEALQVGAIIEDLDLFDLARWQKTPVRADIQNVYANLERGSRNHLRTFYWSLKGQGVVYVAQYLGKNTLQKIVDSPHERGGG